MSVQNLSALIDEAIELQEVDMTQEGSGGGGLMPEGYAMARLVTYIELGQHPQEYQGKAKAPAREVVAGFKLYGGEDNCYDGRFIKTFDLSVSNNPKSALKILFDRLNWEGNMKHMAQALGKGFLVPITINKSKTTGKEGNRINLAGILPPIDVVSKAKYPIPECEDSDLTYFFFDKPTTETWASLFVEGNWDDGKSKNRMQEKILTALDYPGSALEQLVSGVVLPDLSPDPEPAKVETKPVEVAPAKVATTVPSMPSMPALPVMPE
jgi:hypothetical protein